MPSASHRHRSGPPSSGPIFRGSKSASAPYPPTTPTSTSLDLEGATDKRVRAAYSAADWRRLVHLKDRYDPSNLFRYNRNVPGSATAGSPYVH